MDKSLPSSSAPQGSTEVPGKPAHPKPLPDADWQDLLWPDDEPDAPVRPLTQEEAQALSASHPSLTAWQVIAVQAVLGVVVALVWGGLAGSGSVLLSSLYGAGVAVLPNVLMARGVFGPNAGKSVGGLLVWELIKMGCAGVMLALAPVLIQPLGWAAMLVTMVLCMKVIGVALFVHGRRKKFN